MQEIRWLESQLQQAGQMLAAAPQILYVCMRVCLCVRACTLTFPSACLCNNLPSEMCRLSL